MENVSHNELILPADDKGNVSIADRLLGITALICAPMLLLQVTLGTSQADTGAKYYSPVIALLGVLYIGGWICGAVGMFRQKVYGATKRRGIIFAIQMIFLSLAFMFSVQETTGITYENGGGIFFGICDAGYPLSHLFMIVVGIFTVKARIWKGIVRIAPFMVGSALPLTFALMPIFGEGIGVFSFAGLVTVGLGIIGLKVATQKQAQT